MKITGHTKIVGIFGDPIGHTLSPAMQNAAFERLGLDMAYVPFHVKADGDGDLKKAVEALRAMNFSGVNVTIPHKESVMKYLDEADDCAQEIGAVNTVVNRDGRLFGFNTDGPGYLKSLKEETGFSPKGKNAIILGAGGAARSIVHAFVKGGAKKMVIANRTVERAEALAREFSSRNIKIEAASLDKEALERYAPETDLLVNTTSLGMMGRGDLNLPFGELPKYAVVSDIVYRPLMTELLKAAKRYRLKTHGGLGMLIHQGAIGFELWTGKKAPIEVMRKAALKALKKR